MGTLFIKAIRGLHRTQKPSTANTSSRMKTYLSKSGSVVGPFTIERSASVSISRQKCFSVSGSGSGKHSYSTSLSKIGKFGLWTWVEY